MCPFSFALLPPLEALPSAGGNKSTGSLWKMAHCWPLAAALAVAVLAGVRVDSCEAPPHRKVAATTPGTTSSSSTTADSQSLFGTYPIVDTGVAEFSDSAGLIAEPANQSSPFYGQDATYRRNAPSYADNGDGTVTDGVTGLTWQRAVRIYTFDEAFRAAATDTTAGHADWRVPTVKQLYSLILFTGHLRADSAGPLFIDTDFLDQPLGDAASELETDAQTWSATEYVGTIMDNEASVFGVNFVDGRLKAYPKWDRAHNDSAGNYFRFVRGNVHYGVNNLQDNANGTVADQATGLMWQQHDSGRGMDWQAALAYCEGLVLAGHADWKLPSAKELHSIVDYSRDSPAIDASVFWTSEVLRPDGYLDWPYFWTSSTHKVGDSPYAKAAYIAFGKAAAKSSADSTQLVDAHGAGAQRSDPKSTDGDSYPAFFGPQNDLRVVDNHVRCVRVAS